MSLAPPADITADRFRAFAPACREPLVALHLDAAAKAYGITTPRRVRHWMAQLHHESLGFTRFEESLNYSAERLTEVWPGRFPTIAAAAPYARNPRALAEKVYGGRLGNVAPGDGWRYRGGGLIELTGLANYRAASAWCGMDLAAAPELARSSPQACVIAAAFWSTHGLNAIVDRDPDERAVASLQAQIRTNEADDARQARRVVNGGAVGLDAVMMQLARAGQQWSGG